MPAPHRHDVVVIGAGFAGLHAAAQLQARGVDVKVLEGQNRVGGRVHSMRQRGGTQEAGGTYIGAGYTRVIGAAAAHGIDLIDVTPVLAFFREQELVLGQEIIHQADWPAHPANPFPEHDRTLMPWFYHRVLTARENPLAHPGDWLDPCHRHLDVSLREWMRGLGLSDAAIALGYGLNVSFGDSATDVSTLLMFFRAAFSIAQRKLAPPGIAGYTAKDGVQRIPEAMAAALEAEVALEKIVTAITKQREALKVRCADGSEYRARDVICALPFSVLRHIAIDPPLTGALAQTVQHLPYQPMTQIYLAHKSEFWNDDGFAPSLYTDGVLGMVSAARNGEDPDEVTSFTAWAMGPNARRLDALGKAAAGRLAIAELEALRPAAKGQFEFVDLHSWGTDPFARGGWAYFRPGQIAAFGASIGAAQGRLRFCGEHLARTSRGMEGAMESAERVVTELLEAYSI